MLIRNRLLARHDKPMYDDDQAPLDPALRQRLAERVGRLHLSQRLGIEHDHETQVIGRGRNWFHIENWTSLHALIRHCLRLALLYRQELKLDPAQSAMAVVVQELISGDRSGVTIRRRKPPSPSWRSTLRW